MLQCRNIEQTRVTVYFCGCPSPTSQNPSTPSEATIQKSTMKMYTFSSSISFLVSVVLVATVVAGTTISHVAEVEISTRGDVNNDRRDSNVASTGSPSSSSKGQSESSSEEDDDTNSGAPTSALLMTSDPQVMRARAIFQWIHHHESNDDNHNDNDNQSKGGFINEKQTIRRANQDDITSHIGVFASQNIQQGELLAQIPWHLVIQSDDPKEKGQLPCGTGKTKRKENVSEISYIFTAHYSLRRFLFYYSRFSSPIH
jgi:hypothetical protein